MNFYHEGFFKLRLNESIVALHHSNVAATAMMQLTTVSTAVQHHRHWATMAGIFRTIITNSVETKFFWTFPAHSYYLIYYFYYIKNIFLCNKIIIRQRKKKYAANICYKTVIMKEHWIWHPLIHCDPGWECTRRLPVYTLLTRGKSHAQNLDKKLKTHRKNRACINKNKNS